MRELIDGYRVSQLICVAAELGIADLLRDGPVHHEELARASASNAAALHRLLRALSSFGVFSRMDSESFALNARASCLRSDVPGSLRAWAVAAGCQWYGPWGHLRHAVKTGETAFDHLNGTDAWQHRKQDPSAGRVFNEAMSGFAALIARAVVDRYDFSGIHTIVDVGGGQGTLLAAILEAAPGARGILFDLEPAVEGGRALMRRAGLEHRCDLAAGSFFDGVPAGGDAYVLSRIVHDWSDEDATRILRSVRRAMKEGQKLIIIERIMDTETPGTEIALSDVNMLVMNGGRERSEPEFRNLLLGERFELLRTIATSTVVSIIEARASAGP